MYTWRSGLFILFFVLTTPAWSQMAAAAETLSNLVQGRLYVPNYFPIRGNPFLNRSVLPGQVNLLGKDYTDLPLWYDIYADALILLHDQGANQRFIQLNKEQVQYFSIEGRRFINVEYSRFQDLSLKSGYYELALDDHVALLIKRSLELKVEGDDLISSFSRKDSWFLIKDGQAFELRNKNDLLGAAGKKYQSQMLTFMKKQKIRVKKAGDEEWLQLATYLNTLQSDSL